MPRHCSAGGCKARDNRETRNAGVTFHKLPKGSVRRNLWITNSHRTDSWDPQTDFVYFCSKHFTPDCFELTSCSGIRRLKEDALPTVFESSATRNRKPARTAQKQEDRPVSFWALRSGNTEPETEHRQLLEEHAAPRSSVPSAEASEDNHEFPEDPPALDQLSHTGPAAASPPPDSGPPSPSRYMRRLPPPPGFYLSKEHNYAQLCPLLWRRRYDQVVDCLEKALRQLHAARRRENRLRSTVLRFRDKQLKHTLSQEGSKHKGTWRERKRGKRGSNLEESDSEAKSEDAGWPSDTYRWSDEERGGCVYCGRGAVQVGDQAAQRSSKTDKIDGTERIRRTGDIPTVGLETNSGTADSERLCSQILVQTAHEIPDDMSLPAVPQSSGSQQKLRLSQVSEAAGQEDQPHLQQQLFWVQDGTDGQVILVPAHRGFHGFVANESQTVFMSDVDPKSKGKDASGKCVLGPEAGPDADDPQCFSNERKEDVREKLKEHLEGFHLQLSNEFIH